MSTSRQKCVVVLIGSIIYSSRARSMMGKIVQKEKKRPKKKEKEEQETPASFHGSIEYGKE